MDARRSDGDSSSVALQDLIRSRRRELDMSLEDVARQSGGQVIRQTVGRLETHPIKRNPGDATIKGLAAGLKLPVKVVAEAVAASLNLQAVRDPNTRLRMWVDEAEERLGPDEQATLAEMLPSLIELLESRRRDSQ